MKSIAIILGLLFMFILPIMGSEDTEKEIQRLNQITKKIQENNAKINPKKKEKRSAEKQLGTIAKELRKTELKLKNARKNLDKTKTNAINTERKISEIEEEFKEKKDLFSKRLVEIYKKQDLGFIEFLLTSEDLVMATQSQYYFERLLDKDMALIQEIQTEYKRLKKEKNRLDKQTISIQQLNKEIAQKEKSLEAKKSEQKSVISKLQSEIDRIERENRELTESSEEISLFIQKEALGRTSYYGTNSYIKPVDGWISSRYGYRKHPIFKRRIKHNGIDIAANTGYRIKSTDTGIVIFAGEAPRYRGYGKITIISHGKRPKDGKEISSFYAHQSRILVKKGDLVRQGDEIGWVGSTGYATGPHLHFEIRVDGTPADPMTFLNL